MNDTVIIVTVVLVIGIVAAAVFVIWRTRYQPVKNPFRAHNDAPVEQVVIRDSDFRPSTADSRRAAGEPKHASPTGADPGDLLLRGMAIGHIASALHATDDSTHQSPSADGEISERTNESSSGPFSSDPGISSDGGGEDSGGGSGDSGGGSE